MTPRELQTRHTLAFIARFVSPRARLLEVGAGGGHLARAMVEAGHSVVALDAKEEAVEEARALGVDARRVEWPDFPGSSGSGDEPFDAVLFTRSLHHMHGLDASVAGARPVLGPGGRVLVDDFSVRSVDEATAGWLVETVGELLSAGEIERPTRGLLERLVAGDEFLSAWRERHDDLHDLAAMRAALSRVGEVTFEGAAPFLYRYVADWAPDDETGAATVRRVFEEEERRIASGAMPAVGARLVADVRP